MPFLFFYLLSELRPIVSRNGGNESIFAQKQQAG